MFGCVCCTSEDANGAAVVQEIGDADDERTFPMALVQQELFAHDASGPPRPLKVKILEGADVRRHDAGGETFATCEILGKPSSQVASDVTGDVQCPVWNFEASMPEYCEGDDLVVSVWDQLSEGSAMLGKVLLPSKSFHPDGFCGWAPLEGIAGEPPTDHKSYVKLKITAEGGARYPAEAARTSEFTIALDRGTGSLGLDLDLTDGVMARVSEVKPGYPVDQHNKTAHLSKQVKEGDYICAVNGAVGIANFMVQHLTNESKLTLSLRRPLEFAAEIDKKGRDLGLELSYEGDASRFLLVKRVSDGPVQDWNEESREAVRAGDRVVAVSGRRGTCLPLLEGLRASEKATLTFARAAPTPSDGPVDVHDLPRMSRDDLGQLAQPAEPKYRTALVQVYVRSQPFGGSDKSSNGHRYDSVPFANGMIAAGMSCQMLHYLHEHHEAFFERLRGFDAVLVRCNPGHVKADGGSQARFDESLRQLRRAGVHVWPSPDVVAKMGTKEALVRVAGLGIGLEDTDLYRTPEALSDGLRRTLAFQPRVIKQHYGSSGEGIWVVKLKQGNYCGALGERLCSDHELLDLLEASDNHAEVHSLAEFLEFCVNGRTSKSGVWSSKSRGSYLEDGASGGLVDQRFCPRIAEGELRYSMVGDTLEGIIQKRPREGGISGGGAVSVYTSHGPDEPRFRALTGRFLGEGLEQLMPCLGLAGEPLPLWWTADFINSAPVGSLEEQWVLGKFNCSCVGISSCLAAHCRKDAPLACHHDIAPEDQAEARRHGEVMGRRVLGGLSGRAGEAAAAAAAAARHVVL